MDMQGLAVLLDVVGRSRPEAWHLEIAPAVIGRRFRKCLRRLPAPQAVQADALAGWGGLPIGLVQIPNGFDPRGEPLGRRCVRDAQSADDQSAQTKEIA